MEMDPKACYRAMLARDERYDGRFFVCVKTTGIYCRPICPAGPPKLENCDFVPSAAAAAEVGYRPCLRCKPECSPDLGLWQGTSVTVSRGLRLIEEGALDESDVEALANRLGVGERHLRRLFRQHVGASPIAVAQTRRVLLAKQLIHNTDLPMTDVALASGFSSVRRFNETFQQLYDRPPSQLRRKSSAICADASHISLLLPYRSPYDWEAMLGFLAARVISGVERVCDQCYHRAIEINGSIGTMQVGNDPERSSLRVTVSVPRIENLSLVVARCRHLFDLRVDPIAIASALENDPDLKPLIRERPGLRVPGAWDGFEIAVRAVLGQQISVAAANKLAAKLVSSIGSPIGEPLGPAKLTRSFPKPERFDFDSVLAIGMPRKRAEAIVALADAVVKNPQMFDPKPSLEAATNELCSLPGIGQWTAQYIAMRVLRESDAFPDGDVALRRTLSNEGNRIDSRELLARAERWRPWRSYATLHLWTAESRPTHKKKRERVDAIQV